VKLFADVNLKLRAITGWAGPNEDVSTLKAELFRNGTSVASVPLDVQRKDVKEAGLHPTGRCGFKFSELQHGLVQGNFYHVLINSPETSLKKGILYGDVAALMETFDRFEILPRNDYSILEPSTKALLSQGCDLINLKKLLIRLRRGKRAFQCRRTFKGVEYAHKEEDWNFFRGWVEENIDILTKHLSMRYLWSLLDVFADYAETAERLAALAVSNILYQERFAQTYQCIFDLHEKKELSSEQSFYWGGMKTNCLAGDDSYDVFLTRMLENLEPFPLIKNFFSAWLLRASETEKSILGCNMKHSEYFQKMADCYRAFVSTPK